jgi:hypothetical protein
LSPGGISFPAFLNDRLGGGGIDHAPILFVADDWSVGDGRSGWPLSLAALHEFAEFPANFFGHPEHLLYDFGMLRRHIITFAVLSKNSSTQ